jgi:hypothetical protein
MPFQVRSGNAGGAFVKIVSRSAALALTANAADAMADRTLFSRTLLSFLGTIDFDLIADNSPVVIPNSWWRPHVHRKDAQRRRVSGSKPAAIQIFPTLHRAQNRQLSEFFQHRIDPLFLPTPRRPLPISEANFQKQRCCAKRVSCLGQATIGK